MITGRFKISISKPHFSEFRKLQVENTVNPPLYCFFMDKLGWVTSIYHSEGFSENLKVRYINFQIFRIYHFLIIVSSKEQTIIARSSSGSLSLFIFLHLSRSILYSIVFTSFIYLFIFSLYECFEIIRVWNSGPEWFY